MNFDDLKLRSKNLIPLGIMALTMFAMLAFGASRLLGFSHAASAIIERRDVGALDLSRAGRSVVYIPYSVFGSILFDSDTPAGRATQNDFKTAAKTGLDLLKSAAELLPDHAQAIDGLSQRLQALSEMSKAPYEEGAATPGIDRGVDLKPSEIAGAARATKLAAELDAQARNLLADLNSVRETVLAENSAQVQALRAQSASAITMLFLLGGLSAVLASAFAYWMTSTKVERPLKALCDRMRALAQGDLSVEIEGAGRRDEIGEMARAVEVFKTNALDRRRVEAEAAQARGTAEAERAAGSQERARTREAMTAAMTALRAGLKALADGDLTARLNEGFATQFSDVRDDFNAAADKLKVALGLVVRSTGAIQSSSLEIAHASDNLSERTEQQAASIEETAAAMEEITNTLKTSAGNAKHAAEVVGAADSDAKKGAVVVRQAVEAMDAIAESSNQIGQIIGVIDEIAFQTNLLALNAGVEAARAGDSGRGFAVVAMEVRALAQRSAEAAKEIKALVSTSGAQVHSGVKLVAETGKALDSIIAQVSEINKVVANIAEATQQQATGVDQINSAIAQMDQNTQQNATMVEQSTAASHALSKEMGELTRLVEQFRIGEAVPSDHRVGDLRASLKAVAPHAFVKPAPPPRAKAAPAPAPKLARASGTDWTEF